MRERLFVAYYLATKGNGKEAAQAAGYRGDLRHRACSLLKQPRIAALVETETQRLLSKFDIKKENALLELARVAFFDPRQCFDEDGRLKEISEMDANTAAAIAGFDYKGGVTRVRFVSKLGALDLMGRFLNLWIGKGDSSGDRLAEVLAAMRNGPAKEEKKDDKVPFLM
jgi:phage terminase small subunit